MKHIRQDQALEELTTAFKNFDKWKTYSTAFTLLDSKLVRLLDILDAASKAGIQPSVIMMRRRDWLTTKAWALELQQGAATT